MSKQYVPYPDTTKIDIKESPIEYAVALEEFGNKVELLDQVIKSFLTRLDKQIQVMRKLAQSKNTTNLKSEAHKLYGAASNLRAPALSLAAFELENTVNDDQWANTEKLIDTIANEFEKLKKYKAPKV